jgi:hypothetical protein
MSERDKDGTLMLMEESGIRRLHRILSGLRADKASGEYRFAKFELFRILSSWGLSVGISLLIVIALLTFAVGQAMKKDSTVEVVVMQPETVRLEEIREEINRIEQPPPDTENYIPDAPVIGEGAPVDIPGPKVSDNMPVSTTPIMSKSPLILKGLAGTMANRTASARSGARRDFGGSERGEEAVMRALRWLKAHQDADGSWRTADKTDATAMAGLALLCFLAHNETPSSVEFGQTVENAMKFIVSKQAKNGSFGREYTHGICTYALSEGFALTKIMALRDAVERGMDVILSGQQPQGGYDYAYKKAERWDLSVAGWQFQAMKAAKMAGLGGSRLDAAIRLGGDFLRQQAFAPNRGGFGYSGTPGKQGGSATLSMTGAGTLCLQLLGYPNVPEVRAGLEFMKETPCVWTGGATNAPKVEVVAKKDGAAKNPIYAWYYITQAKFQAGGKDWDRWNSQFANAVISGQEKDGHWDYGDHGGAVYSTTLCCLMLEVYYRYLPTYKHAEEITEVKAAASDDIVVEVN